MTEAEEPVITEYSGLDFTCVTFYPDLAKFGVKKINSDLMALFERRAYDVAATVNGIQVILNGKTLPVSGIFRFFRLDLFCFVIYLCLSVWPL